MFLVLGKLINKVGRGTCPRVPPSLDKFGSKVFAECADNGSREIIERSDVE